MKRIRLQRKRMKCPDTPEHLQRLVYGRQATKGCVIAHEVEGQSRLHIAYVYDDSDPAFVRVNNFFTKYRLGRCSIKHIWSK